MAEIRVSMNATFLEKDTSSMTFIKTVSSRLIIKWEKTLATTKDNVVNVSPDLFSSALNIISLVAFAKDIDNLRKGDLNIGKDFQVLSEKATTRMLSPLPYWDIPIVGQSLDGCGWILTRLKKQVENIIDEHECSISGTNIIESSGLDVDRDEMKKHRPKSFLSKILQQNKREDDVLNRDNVFGHLNLLTLFAAGSDTSSISVIMPLFEIAVDNTGSSN